MEKIKKNASQGEKNKQSLSTVTFQVPASLKNAFKSKTSAEGRQVKDVLIELMEKYIKSN